MTYLYSHPNFLEELTTQGKKILFLTGAGVSMDSGIPDYKTRDANWTLDEPRQEVMSLPYFMQEPERFWSAYWASGYNPDARPNVFHRAVAKLDETNEVLVATQNIDGLHLEAGSQDVIEVHGTNSRLRCVLRGGCGKTFPITDFEPGSMPLCPTCDFVLKPDASLFFEGVNGTGAIREFALEADYIVVAGTSLRVGPINEVPFNAHFGNPDCIQLWVNVEEPHPEYDFFEHWGAGSSDFGATLLEFLEARK